MWSSQSRKWDFMLVWARDLVVLKGRQASESYVVPLQPRIIYFAHVHSPCATEAPVRYLEAEQQKLFQRPVPAPWRSLELIRRSEDANFGAKT